MADTVTTPDVTTVVDQSFFLMPLGGPQHPQTYLDRFPEAVYNKGLDSHLVKFMYALLGPSGVGWLRKNYLEARLVFEDFGMDTFDLDDFYGDPLRFGRILEETYDQDPNGILPRDQWEEIRAKDAAYRNRALDYISGVRAGNTPQGIHLVARSALGHECEIVENYRYIYDQHSDDPLGLTNFGTTNSTEEFVVLPRRELPTDELQVITITGSPTGGTFALFFPVGNEADNTTVPLAYNTTANVIQMALRAVGSIGYNVDVSGGPLPDNPIKILFTGQLAYKDVPQLQIIDSLTGGTGTVIATITTERNGASQTDEVVHIAPREQRYLRDALGYIKPVGSIATYKEASGTRQNQVWHTVKASGTRIEVIRFVTGQTGVRWPTIGGNNWIEAAVEHEAPRTKDLVHHYRGYHNVANIVAYTDAALSDPDYLTDDWATAQQKYPNSHVGSFTSYQQKLVNALSVKVNSDFVFTSDRATADYAEPLTVSTTNDGESFVNGIYPTSYSTLPGVPPIKYSDDQFWASFERTEGDDYLEIDLGTVQPVNYLYFEITRKPYDIEVDYDVLGQGAARSWNPVTYDQTLSPVTSVGYDVNAQNPWQIAELWITNKLGKPIFTRYLRLKFSRRNDANSPFTDNGTLLPYSVEVRNLRVARNLS